MVWAVGVRTKRFAYCAELGVRFFKPVLPNQEFVAVAELVAIRRGKLFETRAELRNSREEVHASATGKYLPIREAVAKEMATDFLADPGWVATSWRAINAADKSCRPTSRRHQWIAFWRVSKKHAARAAAT